ncbi:reverse transcriptase N-terminal domain-containing protein [Paraburkholderia youngii]|uniref:reverse transcriptase N-terminal domain-containing protein n=1 Tax=Paraburkholderia youngii TaxID=2782701 RepID=UPI001FE54E3A|nr:reverse transcriptase N-terminal domain-containing protein [Paraburkholderia youngii]
MTATGGIAQPEAVGAGAPSRPTRMWLQADWPRIKDEVKRLQARIAKATKEGRGGKVSALRRLLTRSYSGKMLAVKRVSENRGKRTPGIDGKLWSNPAARWKGMEAIQHHGYRALPLRRIYIPKSNGKKRPLGIPRMLCRAMQALWKFALEPIAETLADPNSDGFRPERSTADAIECCFTTLAKRKSSEWILEGDIRGCFDNFSHDWILQHIPMDKVVLRRWLKAGFIDEGTLFATEAGTPQGNIICKRHSVAAWTELMPVSKVMPVTSSDGDYFGHTECAIIEPQGPTELHTRVPTASCRRGVRAGYFGGQARAGARTESEYGVQVAPATAGGPV